MKRNNRKLFDHKNTQKYLFKLNLFPKFLTLFYFSFNLNLNHTGLVHKKNEI